MKAVLISIRPEWCEKIISGEKTIEVRKTRPKLETTFKCYIYCTKNAKMQFWTGPRYSYVDDHSHNAFDRCGNGKVIGEFLCDQIIEDRTYGHNEEFYRAACVSAYDAAAYAMQSPMYGWHISDLRIYDHPRDLWEFTGLRQTKYGLAPGPITRPPQSWRYVEEEIWND
jgi:predicted transcriptional regulator